MLPVSTCHTLPVIGSKGMWLHICMAMGDYCMPFACHVSAETWLARDCVLHLRTLLHFASSELSASASATNMKINSNVQIIGNSVTLVPYRKEHVSLYHAWMVRLPTPVAAPLPCTRMQTCLWVPATQPFLCANPCSPCSKIRICKKQQRQNL